ncbi:MAG: hypothetical protein EGR82_02285 [Ruminococcus bicirculans]|nr:hypothetical protein [Ruminococcus bicirculans (ex Wegman et al. 2014)]
MGIFSKLFGAKDNTSAVKEYSFIADIAAFIMDNDSDSYELIIASLDVYKRISAIAKNNGYSIITL